MRGMLNFSSGDPLYRYIHGKLKERVVHKPQIVLVGGCSRSGKTTLISELSRKLTEDKITHQTIKMDCWLISLEKRSPEATVLERYECKEIIEAVQKVREGEKIYPPVYDVVSRRRIAERGTDYIEGNSSIILIDGVISLALKELLDISFIKIFVSASDPVRIERLNDFYLNLKGLSAGETQIIIHSREKEEVAFIKKTAESADIIFDNS